MKMKVLHRYNVIFVIQLFLWLFVSCQKFTTTENDSLAEDESEIKIVPRAAANSELVYPINVYVFDKSGNKCTSQTLASDKDQLKMNLSLGKYTVVSLGGTTTDYSLEEDVSLTSKVLFANKLYAENPILYGNTEISIEEAGKSIPFEILLSYKVAALNVELKDIPLGVDAVKVRVSPLYQSFLMNGEFSDEGGACELDCTQNEQGAWCASSMYIFQGSGQETKCEIGLKTGDKVDTHTYVYKGIPLANHPFNMKGNYKGQIVQGGSFTIKGWEKAIDVDFEFGSNTDSGENGGDTNVDTTGIPEPGTIWNGCIVLSVQNVSTTGADLLLMSLDEWEVTAAQASAVPKGYSVNGISDWRYPTDEEAKFMRDKYNDVNLDALNETIIANNPDNWEISDYSNSRYFCKNGDEYYSFQFIAGKSVTKAGIKKPYLVRLVKTYSYIKQDN